jgi:uncharacterized protein YuzE
MRHSYDPVADAVYICLTGEIAAGGAVKSKVADLELNGGHIAHDFDNEGRILGIEIVGVSRIVTPEGTVLLRNAMDPS